jgi:hypothetical protein
MNCTIITYMGVRVSEREAHLLQIREDAHSKGWEIPEPMKSRSDWLAQQCEKVADWKATH